MKETVGDKIKKIREKQGISQEALAYQICTQSQISRIENNKHTPSYYILIKIAKRFGVDVSYFIEESENPREDYINEVRMQLEEARRNRNYNLIYDITTAEEKSPLFKDEDFKKYLLWHKAISEYHLFNNTEKAIRTLKSCLSDWNIQNTYTGLDIEILNSVGIIYRNEKRILDAKLYLNKAYSIIENSPKIYNERIKLKILYNLSKVYTDLQEMHKSIKLCLKGLNHCKKREDLFLFAEFHYQIGRNFLLIDKHEKGLSYWEKAKNILQLEDKKGLADLINKEMNLFKTTKKIS